MKRKHFARRAFWFLTTLLLFVLSVETAEAHVKWFVEFDVSQPPAPIGEVLSGDFVKMFLVSVAGVYVFFLLDRYLYEKGVLAEFDRKLKMFDDRANTIMRAAAGVFFLSLFVWYLVYGTSFY